MARQQVVEIKCDRCARKEYRDAGGVTADGRPVLTIVWAGDSVEYQDLCTPCARSVGGYIESIAKDLKNKSPVRQAKKKAEKAEAPDKPAPPPPPPPPRRA